MVKGHKNGESDSDYETAYRDKNTLIGYFGERRIQ